MFAFPLNARSTYLRENILPGSVSDRGTRNGKTHGGIESRNLGIFEREQS